MFKLKLNVSKYILSVNTFFSFGLLQQRKKRLYKETCLDVHNKRINHFIWARFLLWTHLNAVFPQNISLSNNGNLEKYTWGQHRYFWPLSWWRGFLYCHIWACHMVWDAWRKCTSKYLSYLHSNSESLNDLQRVISMSNIWQERPNRGGSYSQASRFWKHNSKTVSRHFQEVPSHVLAADTFHCATRVQNLGY